MKRAAVVAFIIVFAACMLHYFFAEDHCPVHCQLKGGRMGHVHPHHGDASSCLCFWISLFSPEPEEFARVLDVAFLPTSENLAVSLNPFGADIAHPPKSFTV